MRRSGAVGGGRRRIARSAFAAELNNARWREERWNSGTAAMSISRLLYCVSSCCLRGVRCVRSSQMRYDIDRQCQLESYEPSTRRQRDRHRKERYLYLDSYDPMKSWIRLSIWICDIASQHSFHALEEIGQRHVLWYGRFKVLASQERNREAVEITPVLSKTNPPSRANTVLSSHRTHYFLVD